MDLVELRARIRAMSRDPEAFGRAAGLQPELVRQVLSGEIRPNAEIQAMLRRALMPEPEAAGE